MTGTQSIHRHLSEAPGTNMGAGVGCPIIAGRRNRWRFGTIQPAVTPLGLRPRFVTAGPLPLGLLLPQGAKRKITLCTWKTDHQ